MTSSTDAVWTVLREFLAPHELTDLLQYAKQRWPDFREAAVLSGEDNASRVDPSHRRARVLFTLERFHDLFVRRLRFYWPHIVQSMQLEVPAPKSFEVQLTASRSGDFFRPHRDNGLEATSSRIVTFVYYFFESPKAFGGGELRLFPAVPTTPPVTVAPRRNGMILFPSGQLHEVLPVMGPVTESTVRFTVNGWARSD